MKNTTPYLTTYILTVVRKDGGVITRVFQSNAPTTRDIYETHLEETIERLGLNQSGDYDPKTDNLVVSKLPKIENMKTIIFIDESQQPSIEDHGDIQYAHGEKKVKS